MQTKFLWRLPPNCPLPPAYVLVEFSSSDNKQQLRLQLPVKRIVDGHHHLPDITTTKTTACFRDLLLTQNMFMTVPAVANTRPTKPTHCRALIMDAQLSPGTGHETISRLMTKPTKLHMPPANTQISLGIHPV